MKFSTIVTNWKTTILGLIPLVAGLLTLTGIYTVTPEQTGAVVDGVNQLADSAINGQQLIQGLIEMVIGIGLIFSRDADKSSESSKAQ